MGQLSPVITSLGSFSKVSALFIKWEYIIMFRRMFVAAAAVVFVAFGVIAGEHKGAITKYEAGTSLTINKVDPGSIELCIIPVTLEKTNFGNLAPDDLVNLEFDILAKYTEKLLISNHVQ
jgi:hypothetical protein